MSNGTAREENLKRAAVSETFSNKSQTTGAPRYAAVERRPGGYDGMVGQKFRPAAYAAPSGTGSDGTSTDNDTVGWNGRQVTADGETYWISEDGCIIPGPLDDGN
jgi:hypothetical protein